MTAALLERKLGRAYKVETTLETHEGRLALYGAHTHVVRCRAA